MEDLYSVDLIYSLEPSVSNVTAENLFILINK